jgi:lipopolysaccharide transport system ATP-binding protein
MKPILEVKGISKKFKISHNQQPYLSLRDSFSELFRNKEDVNEEFWALKDVSFDISSGESVGIIGRNGAGKSTLLKILSKITPPTSGKIICRGRIASLLEVGTGFHQELTGRENIYLNGSILGLKRNEINKQFEAIVDFSGVEKFLDTPLKHYSSGMQLRLAFAVAAHLEPEILIIDEVLAVGDAEFQRKCMGKMNEVSKSGRTILFVSHNMGTISQLCSKAIMLEKGNLITYTKTNLAIDYYLKNNNSINLKIERGNDFSGNHFKSIEMVDSNLTPKIDFAFDENICIKFKLSLPEFNKDLELAMRLVDNYQSVIFTIHEKLEPLIDEEYNASVVVTIPKIFLTPGRYSWVMCINHPGVKLYDRQDDILPFTIIDTGSNFARYEGLDYGRVFANYRIDKI